jgi:hypothetical protein
VSHLKVEMALLAAFEEGADRILAAASVKPQESVIMAVEDRHASWRCHRRGLFPKGRSAVPECDRAIASAQRALASVRANVARPTGIEPVFPP